MDVFLSYLEELHSSSLRVVLLILLNKGNKFIAKILKKLCAVDGAYL